MKAVLHSLQSFLRLTSDESIPSNNQKVHTDAGDGGYGVPLLIRRLNPKTTGREEKQLSRRRKGSRKSSSRRRHLHPLSTRTNSESNRVSPVAERIETLRIRNQSMGLRDCLVKMCSRRVAAKPCAGDAFDKCTSEYYSCGKKGLQNRRLSSDFLGETRNGDYPDGVHVNAHSSTSDSEVSESSCTEGDATPTQGAQPIRLCGVFGRSPVEEGKVSGLSIILAENKGPSNDHNKDMVEVQKMGVFPSVSTVIRDHLQDRCGNGDVGSCSRFRYDEEKSSSSECGVSALSLSLARGVLRKRFPPPLNTLAIQSYSREVCGTAGYCLRSFRRDGRFVLQEVRAPPPKYFRVLREDGRLKLELLNAMADSSQEDDETSFSDVCADVKSPIVREVLYSSNTHGEDTCEGLHHLGMHALCRGVSNTGCVGTYHELMSTLSVNAGVDNPLEHVVLAASNIECKMEGKAEAANISSDVGASTQGIGLCPEMRVLYEGSSTSMKDSWVHPISAF